MNQELSLTGNVIDVVNLSKTFSGKPVLKGLNLTVGKGEIVALLGPNGAGKTTTLEIIEGFQKPTSGTVRVLGVDPSHGGEHWRSRLGIVLQSWRDHSRWKVRELLAHIGSYYDQYSTPDRVRPLDTAYLLHEVGLHSQQDVTIKNLSGGQRRRLDVAIGLIGNPEVLFLDEPTVGFDPEARRDFHNLIHKIATLYGTSIILTTHDLNEAEELADKISILIDGKIAVTGTPFDLVSQCSAEAEISYSRNGAREQTKIAQSKVNDVVSALLDTTDEIEHLQVIYPTLEDFYLDLVSHPASHSSTTSRQEVGADVTF